MNRRCAVKTCTAEIAPHERVRRLWAEVDFRQVTMHVSYDLCGEHAAVFVLALEKVIGRRVTVST
jgi:hypothetical protein